jgi:hypothetical protein
MNHSLYTVVSAIAPKIGSLNQGRAVFLFSQIKWVKAHNPYFHVSHHVYLLVQIVTLTGVVV